MMPPILRTVGQIILLVLCFLVFVTLAGIMVGGV